MGYTTDIDSTTVTLDAGQSLSGVASYLQVDTANAERVLVYIDDGTTGNQPATYDLVHDVHKGGTINDWMFDHNVTGETARSWNVRASGNKWRIDLTNSSGTNGQTYRIFLEAQQGE